MKNNIDAEANYLLRLISENRNIDIKYLKEKCRKKEIVIAKRLFCAIIKKVYRDKITLKYIGSFIGSLSHCTINHAIKLHYQHIDMRAVDKTLDDYFVSYNSLFARFAKVTQYIRTSSFEKLKTLKHERIMMDLQIEKMEYKIITDKYSMRKARKKAKKKGMDVTLFI